MKHTTDLWFAAHLYRLDSTKLVGIEKRGHKAKFKFNYTEEEWAAQKLLFINSEAANIKYIIEKLKDLSYQ